MGGIKGVMRRSGGAGGGYTGVKERGSGVGGRRRSALQMRGGGGGGGVVAVRGRMSATTTTTAAAGRRRALGAVKRTGKRSASGDRGAPVPVSHACAAPRVVRVEASAGVASVGPSSSSSSEGGKNNNNNNGGNGSGGACWASMRVPVRAMAAGEGLGSSGSMMGATLERSSPTLSRSRAEQLPKTETGGGSGGNGKSIHNGGGGGDDEDDDDFEFGDDDGGDEPEPVFVKSEVIPEVYDRSAINAVLAEWYRSLADLPAGLRMAVEMSFISTTQLVRFLSMECRPTIARAVSRSCPTDVARALVGRMMADPQFAFKLALEEALTVYGSLTYEAEQRGKQFVKELDMVLLNTATLMMATLGTVWVLAPSRSFGAAYKFRWQAMLHGLPNLMFEKSTPLRTYTGMSRSLGLAVKGAQLAGVGAALGAANSLASNALVSARKKMSSSDYESALPVPSAGENASGMAAAMGLSGNLRYNALGGLERVVASRVGKLNHIQVITALGRIANGALGDSTRLHWVGLPKRGSGPANPDAPRIEDSFSSINAR